MPRARPPAAAGPARAPSAPPHFVFCKVTRMVQKHEAELKAAHAAKIEEQMLSKDALSQAQAEFEKY